MAKPAEKKKPRKQLTQQEYVLRKFPPLLTEEEEVQVEKEWWAMGPTIAAHREVVTQMQFRTAAEGKERSPDQMETEELEGEPSIV